eukprot:5298822-Pyramimonas_sp.AAC.1
MHPAEDDDDDPEQRVPDGDPTPPAKKKQKRASRGFDPDILDKAVEFERETECGMIEECGILWPIAIYEKNLKARLGPIKPSQLVEVTHNHVQVRGVVLEPDEFPPKIGCIRLTNSSKVRAVYRQQLCNKGTEVEKNQAESMYKGLAGKIHIKSGGINVGGTKGGDGDDEDEQQQPMKALVSRKKLQKTDSDESGSSDFLDSICGKAHVAPAGKRSSEGGSSNKPRTSSMGPPPKMMRAAAAGIGGGDGGCGAGAAAAITAPTRGATGAGAAAFARAAKDRQTAQSELLKANHLLDSFKNSQIAATMKVKDLTSQLQKLEKCLTADKIACYMEVGSNVGGSMDVIQALQAVEGIMDYVRGAGRGSRERERERETDRQTDRQAEKARKRERESERYRRYGDTIRRRRCRSDARCGRYRNDTRRYRLI